MKHYCVTYLDVEYGIRAESRDIALNILHDNFLEVDNDEIKIEVVNQNYYHNLPQKLFPHE